MKAKIYTGVPRTGKTRVANMISEHIGKDKTFWVCARKIKKNISDIPFFLAGIPDSTELIIFDDCPTNFDYSFFFPVKNNLLNSDDIKFRLIIEERGKNKKEIIIPQIIFTTERLDPKWTKSGFLFNSIFDIIEFPLHGVV